MKKKNKPLVLINSDNFASVQAQLIEDTISIREEASSKKESADNRKKQLAELKKAYKELKEKQASERRQERMKIDFHSDALSETLSDLNKTKYALKRTTVLTGKLSRVFARNEKDIYYDEEKNKLILRRRKNKEE